MVARPGASALPARTAVAIDWSGSEKDAGQRRHIWRAVVHEGRLIELKNRSTRRETINWVKSIREPAVVGFDFAFSFPEWFVRQHGCATIEEVWRLVDDLANEWLRNCEDPFWGRPGRPRPVHQGATHRACEMGGAKSVFQIGGAGAVGTASLRGMPFLRALRADGWAIWPFDEPSERTIVEIYPRQLTGAVNKSDAWARARYLQARVAAATTEAIARSPEFPDDESWINAVASEDAFDAAVSAMEMWQHRADLQPVVPSIEGDIWPSYRPP